MYEYSVEVCSTGRSIESENNLVIEDLLNMKAKEGWEHYFLTESFLDRYYVRLFFRRKIED